MKDIKCSHQIRITDKHLGIYHYMPCDRKVVATVRYKSAVNSKNIKEVVCKVHLNSVKKLSERCKKGIDFDNKLKISLQ